MFRPSIEDCLNLWFGKFEQTDQEIWNRFGADVALASRGHYDHWALNVEHPRLLVALVIMLDQFRRNMYRETPEMYACDPRCLALVKRGLRVGVGAAASADRAGVPLPGADPFRGARGPAPLHGGVGPGDGGSRARRSAERLPRDLPPPRRGDHALRPVPAPQQGAAAGEHARRRRSSSRTTLFRFDLPLVRQPDGTLAFAGTVKKRTVKLLDHEYQTLLPASDEARGRLRVRVRRAGRRLHQDPGAAEAAGLHPHRRQRARLHRRDQHGRDQLPRVHRRQLVRAVLAPGGLHAGLHHRARGGRQAGGLSGRSAAPRSSG